jgi:DNA adenine methylase
MGGSAAKILEAVDGPLSPAKPPLKWAGGKRQLLPNLVAALPATHRRYIEPMMGGGALFFALSPTQALLADSNPELINFYRALVSDLDAVIETALSWPVDEATFYAVRARRFEELDTVTAAARLLYLNRTCFNGLYRVNRRGEFNVPWGRYSRPTIANRATLEAARDRLARAEIILGDYAAVLRAHARPGDLVFLDPPYLPISENSDFKRYTKVQFREEDHRAMRVLVEELRERGCATLITNSNHPLMYELYGEFSIEVVETRRNINSRADLRRGQDIIVSVPALGSAKA